MYKNNLDSFQITKQGDLTSLTISSEGIAWESDIKNKFKHPPNYQDIQWYNTTDGKNIYISI